MTVLSRHGKYTMMTLIVLDAILEDTSQVCANPVSLSSYWFMSEATATTCCQISEHRHTGDLKMIFMWKDFKSFPDIIKADQKPQ